MEAGSPGKAKTKEIQDIDEQMVAIEERKAEIEEEKTRLDKEEEELEEMEEELSKMRKFFKRVRLGYRTFFIRRAPPRRIMTTKAEFAGLKGEEAKKITPVPKIVEKHVDEIEIDSVEDPYSYVRIKYDNQTDEYLYEVIEPPLSKDEENVLEILKEGIIDTAQLIPDRTTEISEQYLRKTMSGLLHGMDIRLNPLALERIFYYLKRDFMGYGPIQTMMLEYQVEDISCDGVGVPIFIYHRKYGSIRSNVKFNSAPELDGFVVWMAQKCGKHISVASPMLDATVPDGSRLQETLSTHITKKGSSFTIRRFRENPFTFVDLIKFKTMSTEMVVYLWLAIEHGQSMLICGGTASGKTTTLNAILLFIPPQMKIVTIEDTRELNLPHENWVPTLTRSGFGAKSPITGKAPGEIDMFDLLTMGLRQRPQYLMVGEVRGAEAYTVFQAMATGKASYTTFHAESTQAMVHRMENPPINLPRALITALDIVLLQAQVKVGTKMTRRVKGLTEIVGLDPETNELITNTAYSWNPADDTFNYSGHSYVYEKVQAQKNWSLREVEREVKRRIDLIQYMRKIGVSNYLDVSRVISAYYKDPEKVIKKAKEELAKDAPQVSPRPVRKKVA
jgi:flagellar protein FlaI